MTRVFITYCLTALLLLSTSLIKAQQIQLVEQGKQVSIRGLSVVNDKVAWVSSSKGYTALTTDGGKTWAWQQVKGFEKADFRDIEAFSDKEAIIMSSGTPALVLKTIDGGKNWQVKYNNADTAYFLDAMDFADAKHGYVLGDPINGKFVLLETKNGGESWDMVKNQPPALTGEAAFAASGTCLRVIDKNITIVTGGTVARSLKSDLTTNTWQAVNLPVTQGASAKGAFSVSNDGRVITGGNYSKDKLIDSVACVLTDKRQFTFNTINAGPKGYQSSVEQISKGSYLSTGTSGTNISVDNGINWQQFDTISFNVCRKAKKGNLVLLAGDGGKIAIFKK